MDAISFKTSFANKQTVQKNWHVIDVEGKVLGRVASEIAKVVKGKHKPSYTPNTDCGDYVIVLNAGKVKLTGDKWNSKEYISHSGYPGGQKVVVAKEVVAKHPIRLVENAVRGMLPKNILGRQQFKNLFVYEGSEHPHEAQKPTELKF